jgi:hypothetical protein
MENAHLRLGLLEYVRITEKTSTRIRLRVDRYMGEHRQAHLLSVFGNDSDVGAITAAVHEKAAFSLIFPNGETKEVSTGEHPSCYKGAVMLPGRKHPVRHLVAVSQELHTNGTSGRTLLLRYRREKAWATLASFLGLPADPAWADHVLAVVERKKRIEEIDGIGCNPVLVSATTEEMLEWIGEGLRSGSLRLRRDLGAGLRSADQGVCEVPRDVAGEPHSGGSLREGARFDLRCEGGTAPRQALPGLCDLHRGEGCHAAVGDGVAAGRHSRRGAALLGRDRQAGGLVRAAAEGRDRGRHLPSKAGRNGFRPVGVSDALLLRDGIFTAHTATGESKIVAHRAEVLSASEVCHILGHHAGDLPPAHGQEDAVALMMEGKFSGEGLQALDTDEDLMSAMARELVEKAGVGESADAVWRELDHEREKALPRGAAAEPEPEEEPPSVLDLPMPVAEPSAPVTFGIHLLDPSPSAKKRKKAAM